MKNMINWFEIPAADLSRAAGFYKNVLNVPIEETEMFGTRMGFLPSDGTAVSGAIVQGGGYEPSANGTLVYLNGGEDLQSALDRVEANGGKILAPKTQISPEVGFFAIFLDTEGNKVALHSMK
ncbi:MAG: VOC family protein [Bacteroidia bacterium]|nr:VOC family protein [Bacteroidia bacterium]